MSTQNDSVSYYSFRVFSLFESTNLVVILEFATHAHSDAKADPVSIGIWSDGFIREQLLHSKASRVTKSCKTRGFATTCRVEVSHDFDKVNLWDRPGLHDWYEVRTRELTRRACLGAPSNRKLYYNETVSGRRSSASLRRSHCLDGDSRRETREADGVVTGNTRQEL